MTDPNESVHASTTAVLTDGMRLEAEFSPQNLDDLKPNARSLIGQRFQFLVLGTIPEGEPCAGDWTCGLENPPDRGRNLEFCWVPSRDLKNIIPLNHTGE